MPLLDKDVVPPLEKEPRGLRVLQNARPRQSTVRVPTLDLGQTAVSSASVNPSVSADRLAARQQELANAQQAAELDALINRLRSEEVGDVSEFNSRLADLPRTAALQEGEAKRSALTSGAIGRRGLAGRGLELSGVRVGFEGRNEADLLRRLGLISQSQAEETDAIRRAMARVKSTTAAQIAEAAAKKAALA